MHSNTGKSWFERPVRGIGVNMWAPEWYPGSITRFDAEKLADAIVRARATVGFTFQGFTQDHFGISFFPTELGPRHKNLGHRDHIGAYVEAMHKRDVRVFGYYSFPDRAVWEHNPDWRQRDPQDREITRGSWGALCPNSPYREHLIARVAEIATRYEIDGLLVDSAAFSGDPPGCYCRYCERRFRERFGQGLPRERDGYDTDWRRFVEWRYRCLEELHAEIRAVLRAIRPGLVYTHNAFALRPDGWVMGEDFEGTLCHDDVITSIANWSRSVDAIWQVGLLTRFLRGIGGKPVWVQMGRFPYRRDYQSLPVHELKLAAYSAVTNGGSPFYIDNVYPDGSVDEIASERMGRVYREIEAKADYLDHAEELTFAALYYSRRSRDYFDLAYPKENRYLASFQGTCKALVEGKVPYQIVGEAELSAEQLAKYKLLIMPEAALLDDRQVRTVDAFVHDGGGLISTGRTSLFDGEGHARPSFGLCNILCADYVGLINYSVSFIQPTDHVICSDVDRRGSIPHRGCQIKVSPGEEAAVVARIVLPATEVVDSVRWFAFGQEDVPPGETTGYPAALAHQSGKGRCVYFAGDAMGVYGRYGYPALRTLFLNAIRWASSGQQPLVVQGPLNLECRCFRQRDRFVIHLLSYATSHLRLFANVGGPVVEEGIPCRDISVRLSLRGQVPNRVYLASSGEDLPYELSEGALILSVPELHVHDIVVVECEP
jgi:hypothetical protein